MDNKCEYLYKQERGEEDAEDLQDVWSGRGRASMSTQKEPTEERRQTKRQVQKDKAVDKQKHRDKAKG